MRKWRIQTNFLDIEYLEMVVNTIFNSTQRCLLKIISRLNNLHCKSCSMSNYPLKHKTFLDAAVKNSSKSRSSDKADLKFPRNCLKWSKSRKIALTRPLKFHLLLVFFPTLKHESDKAMPMSPSIE